MKHVMYGSFLILVLLVGFSSFAQQNAITALTPALMHMPSVYFVGKTTRLSEEHKRTLTTVATVIRNHPDYNFSLAAYCITNKYQQQQSGMRLNAIIRYMVEMQGISRDRFIQDYGADGGDCQTIDFKAIRQD